MGVDECHDGKCKKDNTDLLKFITSGLKNKGIDYWLDFGGLLGVVREGDMIEGDDDLDICATMSEHDKIMAYFKEVNDDPNGLYTASANTTSKRCGENALYRILPKAADNKALLDLFFFEEKGDGTLQSLWTSSDDTKVKTIFPTQEFLVANWGFSVNIPHEPESRLKEKYGNDFMVPKNDKKTIVKRVARAGNVAGRCANIKTHRNAKLITVAILCLIVAAVLWYKKKTNKRNKNKVSRSNGYKRH